jgi:hypothetical protein
MQTSEDYEAFFFSLLLTLMESSHNVHLYVHYAYGPFPFIYQELHRKEASIWSDQWVIKNIDDTLKVVASSYCDVKRTSQPLELIHSKIRALMTTRSLGGVKNFLTFFDKVPIHSRSNLFHCFL